MYWILNSTKVIVIGTPLLPVVVLKNSLPYLPPCFIGWQFGKPFIHLIGNILHEPLEVFTLVFLLELYLFTDVPHRVPPHTGLPGVEVLTVFPVQPNLHHSHVILSTKKSRQV